MVTGESSPRPALVGSRSLAWAPVRTLRRLGLGREAFQHFEGITDVLVNGLRALEGESFARRRSGSGLPGARPWRPVPPGGPAMRPRFWIAATAALSALGACSHDGASSPPPRHAVGTSPLVPFDDYDLPHPNSREQLAAALRQRGFLPADAPPGTQLGWAIRSFQRSAGLQETGFPDDETLRRLGIDPATKDRSLDPSEVQMGAGSAAGVSH